MKYGKPEKKLLITSVILPVCFTSILKDWITSGWWRNLTVIKELEFCNNERSKAEEWTSYFIVDWLRPVHCAIFMQAFNQKMLGGYSKLSNWLAICTILGQWALCCIMWPYLPSEDQAGQAWQPWYTVNKILGSSTKQAFFLFIAKSAAKCCMLHTSSISSL